MIPAYELTADGRNVTGNFQGLLKKITYTDKSGTSSDTLSITLDDRERRLALPRKGTKLGLRLGYRGAPLVSMGLFVVDAIEWTMDGDAGDTLAIKAKAADMRDKLKEQRTRTHKGSLKQIFGKIAQQHGLDLVMSPELASLEFPRGLHQSGESDLHFATRLAETLDAVAGPKGGKFLFVKRGKGQSGSGQPIQPIVLTRTDLIRARASIEDRPAHKAGVGYRHDWRKGKRQRAEETAGSSGGSGDDAKDVRIGLRELFGPDDEQLAKEVVRSRLAQHDRLTSEVSVDITGNPMARAEAPVILRGVRDGIDGDYIAETVTHELAGEGGSTGYLTRIDCKTKDGQKGKSKGKSG